MEQVREQIALVETLALTTARRPIENTYVLGLVRVDTINRLAEMLDNLEYKGQNAGAVLARRRPLLEHEADKGLGRGERGEREADLTLLHIMRVLRFFHEARNSITVSWFLRYILLLTDLTDTGICGIDTTFDSFRHPL